MNDQEKILPVFPEEVNLFRPVQMNVAEQAVRWKTWNPSFVGKGSPQRVLFHYPNVGTDFIDLARTQLYMKLRILEEDSDGTFTELKDTDYALPIDLIMQTMWQNVVIKLNGQIVSSSNNTYAYKSFFEYLLSSSDESKKYQASLMGGSPDTRYFNQTHPNKPPVNDGLVTRYRWFKKLDRSGTSVRSEDAENLGSVEFIGKLFADICNQQKYLLNEVAIEISLIPNNDPFRLMVHGEKKARLHIDDVNLQICHVALQPALKMQIDKILDPRSGQAMPCIYPMGRVSVTPIQIPKDSYQMMKTDLWQGEVPSRVIVGLVDSEAFQGHYQKNPFFFDHFNLSGVSFKLGNEDVPSEPLTVNIEASDYVMGLASLYHVANKHLTDSDLGIGRNEYRQGLTLFGFTIDPTAQEDAGQRGIPRRDLSTITLKFRSATPRDITAVVYATFHDEISIDHARVVRVKSNRL